VLQDTTRAIPEAGKPPAWQEHLIAAGLAVSGGLLGIGGAIVQEAKSNFLLPFVAAPIIEEALKPSGLYFVLGKWPRLLRSQLYTACLAALAGLSFALQAGLVRVEHFCVLFDFCITYKH